MLEYDIAILSLAAGFVSFVYYIVNSYMSFRYKDMSRSSVKVDLKEVTILVPVYKEEKEAFEKCIAAISTQGVKFKVVGDGVCEPYRSITKAYCGRFIFLKRNVGKRAALSAGIKHIRTKYTLFVDSDTIIPKNTLTSMLSKFDRLVGGMGTSISIKLEDNWVSYAAEFFQRAKEVVFKAMSSNGPIFVIGGRCCLYKTDAIKSFMLSDEFLNSRVLGRRCLIADDMHITSHILKNGYKVAIDYDVDVVTDSPKSFRMLFKQIIRWARGGYLQFFRDLADGSYIKKGALYSFEMFYIYLIPITVLFIGLMRLELTLSGILKILGGDISGIGNMIFLNSALGSLSTLPYVSFALGITGTSIFLIVLSRKVSRKRTKLLVAGAFMSALMFAASIYALFTVWEQGSWLTR